MKNGGYLPFLDVLLLILLSDNANLGSPGHTLFGEGDPLFVYVTSPLPTLHEKKERVASSNNWVLQLQPFTFIHHINGGWQPLVCVFDSPWILIFLFQELVSLLFNHEVLQNLCLFFLVRDDLLTDLTVELELILSSNP